MGESVPKRSTAGRPPGEARTDDARLVEAVRRAIGCPASALAARMGIGPSVLSRANKVPLPLARRAELLRMLGQIQAHVAHVLTNLEIEALYDVERQDVRFPISQRVRDTLFGQGLIARVERPVLAEEGRLFLDAHRGSMKRGDAPDDDG